MAIAAGKFLGIGYVIRAEAKKEMLTEAFYLEWMDDAKAIASVQGEQGIREFMVERAWTAEDDPARISGKELSEFQQVTVPLLARARTENWNYETWVDHGLKDVSLSAAVTDNLNLIDMIFLILGVGTAFRLVDSQEPAGARPRRRRRRPGEPTDDEDADGDPPVIGGGPADTGRFPTGGAPVARRRRRT